MHRYVKIHVSLQSNWVCYIDEICLHSCLCKPFCKGIVYVLWLWYVSSHVLIFATLQRFWVCFMAVVCVYIRADTYLYTYKSGMFYGSGMCLHMWQYIPLCIHFWYVILIWHVSTYVSMYVLLKTYWVWLMALVYVYILTDISLSTYVFGMLYVCGMCL